MTYEYRERLRKQGRMPRYEVPEVEQPAPDLVQAPQEPAPEPEVEYKEIPEKEYDPEVVTPELPGSKRTPETLRAAARNLIPELLRMSNEEYEAYMDNLRDKDTTFYNILVDELEEEAARRD